MSMGAVPLAWRQTGQQIRPALWNYEVLHDAASTVRNHRLRPIAVGRSLTGQIRKAWPVQQRAEANQLDIVLGQAVADEVSHVESMRRVVTLS